MKKTAFSLIFILFQVNSFFSQQYWGRATTSNYTNEAIDVESDASGNLYVAGYFSGGTSFEQNVAQIVSQGASDIYISKYDANGNLIWVKTFGGTFSDKPTDLVVDHAGNIIVTGQFFGQIAFGTTTLNSSANSKDIFIVKLNNLGNVIWAKKEGGTDSENAYGVTVDYLNNIILTGQFKGTTLIAGQTVTSFIDPTTNLNNYDFFISKYSPTGTAQWLKTGQAKYEERGLSVACDSQNNIFVTGQFSDTLTFAGTTINNNAYTVGFVTKLSPSGGFLWLNQMKAGFVVPYDIEVNSANEPVIIGDFSGAMVYIHSGGNTVINSNFNKKIFVLKIANGGNTIWSSAFSSDNELSARSLSVDAAKNIFVTGFFKCSWTQFHNNSTATFNSVGFRDAYLLQIDNLGNFGYARTFGSKLNDEGQGVAIGSQQQAIICGSHTNDLHIPASNSLSNYSFNGNVFGFSYSPATQTHVSLIGDLSANSFLTNAVNGSIPNYNYFNTTPTDSLIGFVTSPLTDTIHFCNSTTLLYYPQTGTTYGPDYNYLWNTGATTAAININQSGTFSVFVERTDQCSSGDDTIVAILHPNPVLPLLTDNLGLVNSTIYPNYNFCQPDSVIISFSNLCQGCTIQISPVNITDTLPHVYNQSGNYSVIVSNGSCTVTGIFSVGISTPLQYDSIKPYLHFLEDTDNNDTISTCAQEYLHLHVYDSITNPTGIVGQFFTEPTVFVNFNSNPPISTVSVNGASQGLTYIPNVSGWHVFTYNSSLGYNNICGLDTTNYMVTDSIYILVNPVPVGNSIITATDLLCPNGSVYLIANPVYPNLVWAGPNISYSSPNNDSVQVGSAGYYNYTGFILDTMTGCTGFVNSFFQLFEKQPPMIVSNPLDGIVCPGDSVTFTVPNIFTAYNWVGPDGNNLSNINTHTDADAGFYYCHLTDSSGCALTTTPAELNEYTTPSLYASPQSVICSNNPITLNVTYSGQGQVTWINPVSGGNSPQIIVTLPGVYICQIDQCGILTTDSVVVTDGSYTVSLTASDTILCFGDTSILTVDPGYNSYSWNPALNSSNINAVTTSGSYSVIVTNQYGCEAHSDTINISNVPFSFPPLISDTSVCLGNGITLSTPNSVPVDWFNTSFTYLSTGTSFNLPPLFQDTLVYAAYNVTGCPPAYQDIDVEVLFPYSGGMILGDTSVCSNATSQLFLNLSQGTIQWFVNSIYASTGPTFDISGSSSQAVQNVMAIISNHCFSDTIYQNIYTIPSTNLSLSVDTVIICGNTSQTIHAYPSFVTMIWTTPIGTFNGDSLTITANYPNESYVVGQGINSLGCYSNLDSTLILIPTGPQIDIYSSGIACIGDTITLTSNLISNTTVWSGPFGTFIGNQVSFELTNTAGTYTLTIDTLGCSWSNSITINSLPSPYGLSIDTVICFTDWYQMANSSNDLVFTNANGSPIDTLAISDNSWLVFTITSNLTGCSITDSVFIEIVSCSNILPNVITPNGDGINDFFIIEKALLQPNNQLIIVNRWGNVIFKMDGYDNRWGGGDLNDEVYFYTYYPDRFNSNLSIVQGVIHIAR